MNKDYQIIKEDLQKAGIKKGDSLLIHSSFKSLGMVDGGIGTLVDALCSVLGDTGTLVAPSFTYSSVTAKSPVFDHENMPCCVGAVSEFIRNMEHSKRSINPTHSCVVIGAKCDEYVKGHQNDNTPVGVNSPIYKLYKDGGKILMLGCTLHSNSSVHGIEEHFPVPYIFGKACQKYTMITKDKTYEVDYFRHNIAENGYTCRFTRVEEILDENELYKTKIHGADSFVIDSQSLWKKSYEALKKDPYFFVYPTVK